MALKDQLSSLKEPLANQTHNPTMQDNLEDELEETVSLCDLPIYGYDTNYSVTDSEDSVIGDESFEFFSEELVKKVKDSNQKESFLFCGNLILPKQPISRNTQESDKRNHGSTSKGRNQETKRVVAMGSKKSKWYYYGVGLAGIPAEMELSGIRSRQNRRQHNSPVRPQGGCEKEESGGFRHARGLSRLIRDLSCNGQTQANKMVKASLVYIPRVG